MNSFEKKKVDSQTHNIEKFEIHRNALSTTRSKIHV